MHFFLFDLFEGTYGSKPGENVFSARGFVFIRHLRYVSKHLENILIVTLQWYLLVARVGGTCECANP